MFESPRAHHFPSAKRRYIEQARRPYEAEFPFYSFIKLESHAESSTYNALEVSLTQWLSHGLQFMPSFTWNHEMDDAAGRQEVSAMKLIATHSAILVARVSRDSRNRTEGTLAAKLHGELRSYIQSIAEPF